MCIKGNYPEGNSYSSGHQVEVRKRTKIWRRAESNRSCMCFSAFAAINAQTRLMFGRYLEFYVTEKATKK